LYTPKDKSKQNQPLWAYRKDKAYRLENKLLRLEKSYKRIKKDIYSWSKKFLADIHLLAESKAKKVSNNINNLEFLSTNATKLIDNVIEQIEVKKPDALDQTKISTKRIRRRRKRK
jgi:hypothetical protein